MSRLPVIDSTVQKTHEWLGDIKARLGFDNDHAAYAALRAVLHGLRDQLSTDDVAHLGAEFPLLVRGIYYESWNPAPAGADKPAFLDSVGHALREHPELRNTEHVARIVLAVLDLHIAKGQSAKTVHALPREIRALWPSAKSEAV